jgi:hypothetical protein
MSIGISRASLVGAPGRVVFGSASLYSRDAIEWPMKPKYEDDEVDGLGKIDKVKTDFQPEVSFTPDGRWNAATIAALWPYLSMAIGTDIYGASADVPLSIHGADSSLGALIAAAVTKMPDLVFSPSKPLVGQVTFGGVIGNAKDPASSDSYVSYAASGGTFGDPAFIRTLLKRQAYTAAWGSVTGFTALYTQEGFKVSFDAEFSEQHVDGIGIVSRKLVSVGVMVSFIPIGPTVTQVLNALRVQGSGNGIGTRLSANAAAFTITGADGVTYLTIPAANIHEGGFKFGAKVLRNGEVGFAAIRTFDGNGVAQAIATLAAVNALRITSAATLAGGTEGEAYAGHAFTADGGTAPRTFALSGGALPPGLSLASGGALTGTPTTAGHYVFEIEVTDDDAATATQVAECTIEAA